MREWEIAIEIGVILRVRADDQHGAEDLAKDSLKTIEVLRAWRDCVTKIDEWRLLTSSESIKNEKEQHGDGD